jgi:hypothetical protein
MAFDRNRLQRHLTCRVPIRVPVAIPHTLHPSAHKSRCAVHMRSRSSSVSHNITHMLARSVADCLPRCVHAHRDAVAGPIGPPVCNTPCSGGYLRQHQPRRMVFMLHAYTTAIRQRAAAETPNCTQYNIGGHWRHFAYACTDTKFRDSNASAVLWECFLAICAGVSPWLSRQLAAGLPWCFSSNVITGMEPRYAARWRAVEPYLLRAATSSEASPPAAVRRERATAMWPATTADINGVHPSPYRRSSVQRMQCRLQCLSRTSTTCMHERALAGHMATQQQGSDLEAAAHQSACSVQSGSTVCMDSVWSPCVQCYSIDQFPGDVFV